MIELSSDTVLVSVSIATPFSDFGHTHIRVPRAQAAALAHDLKVLISAMVHDRGLTTEAEVEP